jgi:hypothetical protein
MGGGELMGLREYMTCMDSGDPTSALEHLADDLHYALALPGRVARGQSRDDFAGYIGGRAAVDRVHHVLSYSRDGDLELVYGVVTDGGRATGAFVSAARLDADGRIVRYHSSFDTELFVAELEG